jgi:hypothetical protein
MSSGKSGLITKLDNNTRELRQLLAKVQLALAT